MPAQHFVPSFANAVHASSRTQANALRALAISGVEPTEKDWKNTAAAALILGAEWAGEKHTQAEVAKAAGLQEKAVAQQYQMLADRLKKMAPK